MDRKELILRYLEAETSPEEERLMADSFTHQPPADEEELAVFRMLQARSPIETPALPEESATYDRILRRRAFNRWGIALSGMAAAVLLAVFFWKTPGPAEEQGAVDTLEMVRQIELISALDPAEADGYEFKPAGEGFIMTARYKDGRSASFLLMPMDEGQSYCLVSINE